MSCSTRSRDRWLAFALVLLLGAVTTGCSQTPAHVAVDRVDLRSVDPCVNEMAGSFASPAEAIEAVIVRSEALQAAANRCGAPTARHEQCRAIWLASVLDPPSVVTNGVDADLWPRAAIVVDWSLTRGALVGEEPESALFLELRTSVRQLWSAFGVGEDERDDIVPEPGRDRDPAHEARVAALLIERNRPALLEPLRALERACDQSE